ncbi:protein lplB [Clostridium thermosuccinogenes]|jgi:putative aldouronate transport system permease protein|uniref:Protein lplB n=1 Tax=Clostridium thermosuccinogenes TaxID=84032 RepID=A0A2K2EWT3_9CLOT|nr:ABC transporter permease subunit [Pseudoclostridium thermosuccinogenes]AUS98372.1 protein lplB [Pseudoclostridium thermosuccinogenes]PNT90978.1 protein lplB [Pseudoclostridium thermosuccinogenes]PNT98948.1 protein lplB [Pseudoclostridium thermosuccinogenes]PNU00863.1 protein lplB [Pseudoclostridium thermosuccinogenes]
MSKQIALQKSGSLRKKDGFIKGFIKQIDLQLLVIPSIIHIIIFSYIPMYGIIMAFQEFQLGDFPGMSRWVGFLHFNRLFSDPNFTTVLRNTVVISLLKMLINFPVPIIFAVMLNEITHKNLKRGIQTISYLPHFISWVVGATLLFDFFSVDNGAVNSALQALGLIERPIHFFGKGEYFWWMAVGTDLWKELGWNSIIFIASITSIDYELYEAAEIDGAGRFAKMWYITIASIMPTIILLLIFTIGNLLNTNFDQIMMLTNQMGNARLRDFADVIDTYVYRVGLREARYSYAAAAGLFKSVVNILLLLGANKLASKTGNEVI